MKLRVPESGVGPLDHRAVGSRLRPAIAEAEQLLDHTLLALRAIGQHVAQLLRRTEFGVRNSGHNAAGVERKLDGLQLLVALLAARQEADLELVPPSADRVELLQAETDRIDQLVAARARFAGHVDTEALAIGHRPGFGERRQIAVD